MTSSEQRIGNVPVVPHNVPDVWDVPPDYLESEPSRPSQHLCIDAGRTGRTDGVPQVGVTHHSRPTRDVHDRDVPNADDPHVLLTVSDAAELLRIVTQSRPINHDQTELVADLAAIVRRARAIETRSNR